MWGEKNIAHIRRFVKHHSKMEHILIFNNYLGKTQKIHLDNNLEHSVNEGEHTVKKIASHFLLFPSVTVSKLLP